VRKVLQYGEFEVFRWDPPSGPYYSLRRYGEDDDEANCGARKMLEACRKVSIPDDAMNDCCFYIQDVFDICSD